MTPAAQAFAEIYDLFAVDYERTRVPRFRPLVKKLLQLYDTRPKSAVLDAGTGTGLAATLVAPRAGHDGRVTGVDVSENQLKIARQKAKGFGFTQCEFRIGDVNSLDFQDGEFDLVICSFALHGEPAHLFSEFRRVLKPEGGVLLAQDWQPARSLADAAYDELFRSIRVATPDEHLRRLRAAREDNWRDWEAIVEPADYARLANEAGFRQFQGHAEVLAQHFESAKEYVEWRGLEPVHRAELDALELGKREDFRVRSVEKLKPFETQSGLDLDWTAIQMVARV